MRFHWSSLVVKALGELVQTKNEVLQADKADTILVFQGMMSNEIAVIAAKR